MIREKLLSFGSGVVVNLFSEIVVTRMKEGEDEKFLMVVKTPSCAVLSHKVIDSKLEGLIQIYTTQLKNLLCFEGSGISLDHIKNLRLQIGALPNIKSGCAGLKLEFGLSRSELR